MPQQGVCPLKPPQVTTFSWLQTSSLVPDITSVSEQAIGPYDDLLTTVRHRKLKWYGHVTRSSGLAKTILQGTVPGGRKRGRQKKRWEDNIKEWTGLHLSDTLRKAESREEWRELVAKTPVAPLRSMTKG